MASAPGRARRPASPGAEPNNWRSFFSGLAWSSTRRAASTTSTCSPASSRPQLGAARRPPGGLLDDALVARPRRRRLPHGRRQHAVQDPALPDGAAVGDGRLGERALLSPSAGGGSTSSSSEMHGAVFAGRDVPTLAVGEMPGVTIDEAVPVHRPGARRARHGVPVRARRPRPRRQQVAPASARPARPQGLARPLAARPRRHRVEQPVLLQPRPAAQRLAVGDEDPSTASARRRCWRRILHLHRGRRTSTRARSSA